MASINAFPALYLNLGAEMMYVLDSRLRVQSDSVEDREKSDKVCKEILLSFLSKTLLDEVFKANTGTPSQSALRTFFEKVVHSSIMRLNPSSMDKLYDLMMVHYKYALLKMTMPEQIMTVTANHLRALLDLIPLDKDVGAAVEHAYTLVFTRYRTLDATAWYMLRCSMLTFFQDTRIKVSQFVRDGRQLPNGRFVLFSKTEPVQLMKDGQPVGLTQYFVNKQVTKTEEFMSHYKFTPYVDYPDTLDAVKRSTDLGANSYRGSDGMLKIQGGGSGNSGSSGGKVTRGDEMALFESLMSSTTTSNVDDSQIWGMSLFDDEQEEKSYLRAASEKTKVTRIDASQKKKSLKSAMDELKLEKRPPTAAGEKKKKKTKGASVLDLMDEAAARPATAKTKVKRSESSGAAAKPRTRSGSRPTTNATERASSAAPKRAASAKRKPV
ncbi:unnamed protein product [Caenorhabditis sp. 36 PRJEB53466]|nr:unnamed protein product [Caenorhabditis sp. 36 PRJEB53466]